jgi:hypothetical protein
MRSERLHGEKRIFGDEQRVVESSIRKRTGASARDDCSNRSTLESCGDKVMAVEAVASNRKKQFSCRHSA